MIRICILTQSHLSRNPRVVKEAYSLAQQGHQVTILTTFSSNILLEEDQFLYDHSKISYRAALNLIPGRTKASSRFQARLKRKIGGQMQRYLGVESAWSLGYAGQALVRAAQELKADLYIAHQEEGVWAGCQLLRQGHRVAFDLEDWHSEDLLPVARRSRPIKLLQQSEKQALRQGTYVITTSEAMANALAAAYQVNAPAVIYNAFSLKERTGLDGLYKDRKDRKIPSLFWFSQTIGPGRGLELLCTALHYVKQPVELHLRGNCSEAYRQQLLERFPAHHRLLIHPMVSPVEILSRIVEHSIGLALEENIPPSRNYTITNKILHYLLAGVPVVASDTDGQKEVAHLAHGAVKIFENGRAEALADSLNQWLNDPVSLTEARESALKAAKEKFCWEKQEPILLALVAQALYES